LIAFKYAAPRQACSVAYGICKWIRWADLTLPILVGGLEALLETERRRATRQFKVRVAALAEELGFDGVA
jgi:hypothetical protein